MQWNEIEHVSECECFLTIEGENYDTGFIDFEKKKITIFHYGFEENYNFFIIGNFEIIITSVESGDHYSFVHEKAFVTKPKQ